MSDVSLDEEIIIKFWKSSGPEYTWIREYFEWTGEIQPIHADESKRCRQILMFH